MGIPLDETDTLHAKQLYESGLSVDAVAEEMLTTRDKIVGALRRTNCEIRTLSNARKVFFRRGGVHPAFIAELPVNEIVERYQAGEAAKSIAESLGVSMNTIHYRLSMRGVKLRTMTEARRLIDFKNSAALCAKSKSRQIGWGEEIFESLLRQRHVDADPQRVIGTRNIDLAIYPVAVEIWIGTTSPLNDPYCRKRVEYLTNRGWWVCYVLISRRTRVLTDATADQVISLVEEARRNPSPVRKHWVIRGCGEIAAVTGPDFCKKPLIAPSKSCPYHSTINKRLPG